MKTLKLTLAVLMITTAAFANDSNPQVRVLSVKRDIFYFRICQSFLGGTLEVYGENGKMIFSDKLISNKGIVDFYPFDAGLYEIRIRKDRQELSFGYTKYNPKPQGTIGVKASQVLKVHQG